MAATILNSTKQGDKYVSESFEMTSDNAGLPSICRLVTVLTDQR